MVRSWLDEVVTRARGWTTQTRRRVERVVWRERGQELNVIGMDGMEMRQAGEKGGGNIG